MFICSFIEQDTKLSFLDTSYVKPYAKQRNLVIAVVKIVQFEWFMLVFILMSFRKHFELCVRL